MGCSSLFIIKMFFIAQDGVFFPGSTTYGHIILIGQVYLTRKCVHRKTCLEEASFPLMTSVKLPFSLCLAKKEMENKIDCRELLTPTMQNDISRDIGAPFIANPTQDRESGLKTNRPSLH